MNEEKMKVVFEDAEKVKVAYGKVSFENDFVKVVDEELDRCIYINKERIISIRTVGE